MNTQLNIDFNTKAFAYHTLENKDSKQSIVLNAIKVLGKCSDNEISSYLGWQINRVIPRRSELMELGLIKLSGTKMGEFGKPVKQYEINEQHR